MRPSPYNVIEINSLSVTPVIDVNGSLVGQMREATGSVQQLIAQGISDEALLKMEILNELAVILGAIANGESQKDRRPSGSRHPDLMSFRSRQCRPCSTLESEFGHHVIGKHERSAPIGRIYERRQSSLDTLHKFKMLTLALTDIAKSHDRPWRLRLGSLVGSRDRTASGCIQETGGDIS